MRIESFDEFDDIDDTIEESNLKPFALRDDTSEDGTLKWLNENFNYLEKSARPRLEKYIKWAAMYKGDHYGSGYTGDDPRIHRENSKRPKVVDNFIMEFIDARVSQLARMGSNFAAIPWNNEIGDENVAKACEKLLRARCDELDFDKLQRDADRVKFKYGTSFIKVFWDMEKGPEHPDYTALKKIYDGNIPKSILKELPATTVGDVCVEVVTPDKIYPDRWATSWKKGKITHVDEIEWVNIYELKEEYKNKADLIDENTRFYMDTDSMIASVPKDKVQVRHFYHPPTKFLPEGAYIKYCDGCILESTAYKDNHGQFPFIEDFDIGLEDEERLFGLPRISQIEQMQRQYNNISSSHARDLGAGSAPKWLVPKGSVDFRSINNEFTLVEYRGAVPPQLVKGNPISSDSLIIQDRIEKRMGKKMTVYDISRGEVPAGITANSALRFLDEQESQVIADSEKTRKTRVLRTYRKMASIMGQYYKPEDGRTLRVLGKQNEYMIEDMKKADFTKVYDIQLQNTSALPDTKTGKISAIIDLNAATQADPIFRREDIVNMLDMATDETFKEETTYSLDSARMIYNKLVNGEKVPEPEMHDDLIVYYTTMFRAIQSYRFKTAVMAENQQLVYEYIRTIEGLIFLKAQKNQKLAMEIQTLDYYPSFFELPDLSNAPTPQESQYIAQAANTSAMKNTMNEIGRDTKEQSITNL